MNTEPATVNLTIEEAAKLLRLGRTTTYSLIKTGELRSVKIGRLRRIPARCVTEYLNRLLSDSTDLPNAA